MQKKKNTGNTVVIDTDEILKKFEDSCKEVVQKFIDSTAEMAANKIDIKKLRSSKVSANKSLNDYEKDGEIMITPIGNKSVQIEAVDISKSSRMYQPIFRFFMEEGYHVNEAGGILTIALKQVTEETRVKLTKEVMELKERYKREINDHRTKSNQKLKGLPEDELASSEKTVEKTKTKYQKDLETEYERKNKEIMGR